jgi:hypothetical protein
MVRVLINVFRLASIIATPMGVLPETPRFLTAKPWMPCRTF